jgi:hypothetical protein
MFIINGLLEFWFCVAAVAVKSGAKLSVPKRKVAIVDGFMKMTPEHPRACPGAGSLARA